MADIAEVQGVRINYRFDGPVDAPIVMLSNSLGTNLAMWQPQMVALTVRFRVLRYDSRGHGASSVTPGPYAIEQLARDVVGLLDVLRIPRVHFCGLSMGGMVGMWVGANAADRLDRLVLCNTTAKIGLPDSYDARIDKVRKDGLASIADAVLERWLSARFRARDPAALARLRAMLVATSTDGYVASCAAVRDMDQWALLDAIRNPTLVIAGTHDVPTPPADGRRMAQAIANARYVELDAAHISNVEAASAFTAAVVDFLTR
ncbi:MAG: 3-oxoadipate enol-lactonase [Casimicrobiaceae bacterium]